MRRFLRNIILFLLPLFILAYPLDLAISYFLKQSDAYLGEYEVMNDIYSGKARCDIAIYGSSRSWVHINPKILNDSLHKTAYNFGIDGHNFWLQYFRHQELIKHTPMPSNILLSVDVFSLQKREDLYQAEQFLPYMLWNKNIRKYTKSFIGYSTLDYYIPLLRYAGKFQALKFGIQSLVSSHTKFRQNGFRGTVAEWNDDLEKAKSNRNQYVVSVDSASVQLFDQFIQECQRSKVQLILVYTPEYIEGQNYVTNRKEIMAIFKNFSEKYNLPFLDYSTDSISLNKKLFYNASHLNETGANLFSKKLATDLKQYNYIPYKP